MTDFAEYKGEYWLRDDLDKYLAKRQHERTRYATDPAYRAEHIRAATEWAKNNRERKNAHNREYMRKSRERAKLARENGEVHE